MQFNPMSRASSASSTSAIGDAVQQVTANQALGQQAFLQLLSTQLSNQDPLAPTDQTQMLAQLAQFSTVEGVNKVSDSQSRLQATGLLGKTVTALTTVDNTPVPISGKVSSVRWSGSSIKLTLDSGADVTMDQVTQVK